MRNKSSKTRVKSVVKEVRAAAESGEGAEGLQTQLNEAKSAIAKAAKSGVIHKRTAARKVSRLTKLVNSASA